MDLHQSIKRSQLFDDLPTPLTAYEKWLPAFKILDAQIGAKVSVIFRPKPTASATDLQQWQENQGTLASTWLTSVLVAAIDSLPSSCRTRRNNPTHTYLETKIPPLYIRLYKEDIQMLDRALDAVTQLAPLDRDLSWYFLCHHYGQRHLLEPGEELTSHSFGLTEAFDLTHTIRFSAHVAFNISCRDSAYSLFWNRQRLTPWCHGKSVFFFFFN